MSLLEHAYLDLYSDTSYKRLILKYSGRFKGYNANILVNSQEIVVNASKRWKGVSPDIQKGLFQELLVRAFKSKKHTIHMDLYHNFIKSLSSFAPKLHTHPILEQSFQRINERFFNGMLAQPNLRIGNGVNRLGTYEYATDTITISKILIDEEELMDYVMYHELLHKKHKYRSKAGRQLHHSSEFKQDERRFPNAEILEKKLNKLVRSNKRPFLFW